MGSTVMASAWGEVLQPPRRGTLRVEEPKVAPSHVLGAPCPACWRGHQGLEASGDFPGVIHTLVSRLSLL